MTLRTLILAASVALSACSPFVKPELPGESKYSVKKVVFPDDITLSPKPLMQLLSVRADAFLIPGQPYNPWRQAEDRRRIDAFWKNFGYFDVSVQKAEVTFDEPDQSATITWKLTEGPRYKVRSIAIKNAPPGHEAALTHLLPFHVGDGVDLQTYRVQRHFLADHLRDAGFLRAEVYSRAFVDRDAKQVDWVYFVDYGPATRVGSIEVFGNHAVSKEAILDRAGFEVGDPVDLHTLRKRELDLMDLGAFAIARIFPSVGTEFEAGAVPYETWIPPDTGGVLTQAQVDAQGQLVPRTLSSDLAMRIEVAEAPSTQVRLKLGANLDPERFDPYVGTRLLFRNALGELNHLAFEGQAGYGIRWRGDVDEPLGVYGSARLEWLRPGTIGRTGDLRLALAFDEQLFPGFHWRTASVGLGLRTLIDTGLFFDLEPRLRWDAGVGLGALATAFDDVAEPADPGKGSLAGEARASLVWDTRNDGVEAIDGHLVALRAALAPVGDHTWFKGELDLRFFLKLNADMGIGLRAQAGWVKGLRDGAAGGVPVGLRLFGGGAWGMRGFGTQRLSLYGVGCGGAAGDDAAGNPRCRSLPIGASSLFEGGIDFRWLPFRKQFGVVAFADVGGVGQGANPFGDAVEAAFGLGLRVRLWHIPIALDVAYRVTDDAMVSGNDDLDQALVFLRIGEAF
ncbi:MAG: BamA/TamA family outer membrane protein [Deltaproteobacteria bacterium]|nr:BamA/TamA family outer membrane protein [Deltaproteobacteria bacterium]